MADLDTRQKRASCVSLLVPFVLAPPLPDADIDQGDRQHIAFSYAGVAAGAPPPDSGDTKSSGRSGTHRKNTIRPTTTRSGTVR